MSRDRAGTQTHLHQNHLHFHVGRQNQIGLEAPHHGNQQMNSGQEVFVVDDWCFYKKQQQQQQQQDSSVRNPYVWMAEK